MHEAFQDMLTGAVLAVVFVVGLTIVLEKPVPATVRQPAILEAR